MPGPIQALRQYVECYMAPNRCAFCVLAVAPLACPSGNIKIPRLRRSVGRSFVYELVRSRSVRLPSVRLRSRAVVFVYERCLRTVSVYEGLFTKCVRLRRAVGEVCSCTNVFVYETVYHNQPDRCSFTKLCTVNNRTGVRVRSCLP